MHASPLPARFPRATVDVEVAALREQLARLVVQRETLTSIDAPELEARYRLLLGDLQLKVLESECQVRRLRRKIEMVRAAMNHGHPPDLTEIDKRLDADLASWHVRIRLEAARLADSRSRLLVPLLATADVQEMKRLFRSIALRCHPDANPSGGDAAMTLWNRACEAHACGDLDALRALSLLADSEAPASASGADDDDRATRAAALRESIVRISKQIDVLLSSFPFTLGDRLDDDEWIAAVRRQLTKRRDRLADEAEILGATLSIMLKEANDA